MATTTTEAMIAAALYARLASFSHSPSLPIAWPNMAFTPPVDGRYLRANDMPIPVVGLSIANDGSNLYAGLFQVDVFGPINDGAVGPKELAGLVAAHFKRGTRMARDGLRVDSTEASLSQALRSDNLWMVSVTVRYRAIALN